MAMRDRIDEKVFAAIFAWSGEPAADDLFHEATKHDDVAADELFKHIRNEKAFDCWPGERVTITAANRIDLTSLVPHRSSFFTLTIRFESTGLMLARLTRPRMWQDLYWAAVARWEGA